MYEDRQNIFYTANQINQVKQQIWSYWILPLHSTGWILGDP
jgi:hypothetical protein